MQRLSAVIVAMLLVVQFVPTGTGLPASGVNIGSSLAAAAPAQEPATATTSAVTIAVKDARSGAPVQSYKWMVNLDNSHENASVTPAGSYSPVVTTGEVRGSVDGKSAPVSLPNTVAPDRGYLVTVFANDGVGTLNNTDYKIGGKHFRLPDNAGDVVVELQPNPLPLATIKVRIFHDNAPVNGEDDIPFEKGLAGFHLVIRDRVGEVTTDWFGNPICTEYLDYPGGTPKPGTGGFCTSGPDGIATIPNLGPNKYEVEAIPPDSQGWILTATIEGTKHNDAWVQEGATGYASEPEAGLFPQVWFGFVRECRFGTPDLLSPEAPSQAGKDDCTSPQANMTGKTGRIIGRVRSIAQDNEAPQLVLGNPVSYPYIALTNIAGNDEQVWTGRGNQDGTFEVTNVPAGLYQMAIWDEPIDHIIQFRTVRVTRDDCTANLNPCTVNMGDIGVPPWFGKIRGYVYIDSNQNGIRDPGEPGFPRQDLDTRFKDGTIQYTAFSDSNGYYEFPEVFELEHFTIAEVGYGRFKNTAATAYKTDEFGNPIGYPSGSYPSGFISQDLGLAGLLQATITWGGTTNYIDWGKKAFGTGENGGIVGIVFNATTRNELNARFQANEDYEPGVPGAMVRLYAPVLDGSGNPLYDTNTGEVLKARLANTYVSDSWYDNLPKNCIPTGSLGRDPSQVMPSNIFNDCVELPSLLPQIRSGVFDGGYAFEEDCFDPLGLAATDPNGDADNDGIPNRFDPDLLATSCVTLPAVKWVVEVVPPPGYKVVKEEDVNVFSGDQFVPSIPPPACAGPVHTVHVTDDPNDSSGVYNPDFKATTSVLAPNGGSPYEGQKMPLCNERLVTLQDGQNANSDFFIFTDVPIPGRIRGVLLDDLTLQFDPNSSLYGEKRGIPNTPVGIRDFTGKLITTVYSDNNGYWEVLLPSTGTYNCPLPAGPCPGTYFIVGNDPGDVQNPSPNFNPNYQTLPLVFEVWPGTTTYADVAIIPITGFIQKPGTQFDTPPVCAIPGTTPDIQSVSQPYGNVGTAFTVTGSGFGSTQGTGSVALDDVPLTVNTWSSTVLSVTVPSTISPGRHQLMVKNDTGAVSPSGITFHVTGVSYNPRQLHVGAGQPYTSLQAALDASQDGDLILVHPGVYSDKIIMHSNVKLQGYGPGATVLDGRFLVGAGHLDHAVFDTKIETIPFDGSPTVPWGQTLTVLAKDGQFHSGYNPQIDGFKITGGRNEMGNGTSPGQGGGIYVHGYARYLEISNNLVQSNAGTAGGGIILGLPTAQFKGLADNQNDSIRIHLNRVLNNGGIILAGGIAIFNGAENYEIDNNVVCGNYSAEYGAGISHWGKSPGGRVHDNKILFNYAFDEGGGILVAGEPKKGAQGTGTGLSEGSGPVTIERNLIQGNVSNDDGGGIRLLNAVQWKVRIANNMIVNNLATDTGGGISLDDALDVEIVNNTVAKNISTATAEDADRSSCAALFGGTIPPFASCPRGAGLVSEVHSTALLQATKAKTFDCNAVDCKSNFSNPELFNNIFWKNEAFYLTGTTNLTGGGLVSAGYIDLEVLAPATGNFTGRYNDCTTFTANCPNDGTNISADPMFVQEVTTIFDALAFAGDPSFITVIIKSNPGDPQGDYHIKTGSAAVNKGTANFAGVSAPSNDFDSQARPQGTANDLGADELVGPPMHVGDLDGIGSNIGATANWRARVTITVHNAGENPVANATVNGAWSAGDTNGRTLSCTTDVTGRCDVQSGRLSRTSDANVTFTVTNVTHNALSYQSSANHDPDSDSNGTAIVVNRP